MDFDIIDLNSGKKQTFFNVKLKYKQKLNKQFYNIISNH